MVERGQLPCAAVRLPLTPMDSSTQAAVLQAFSAVPLE